MSATGCGIGNEMSGSTWLKTTRSTAPATATGTRANFDTTVFGFMPSFTTAMRSGTSIEPVCRPDR